MTKIAAKGTVLQLSIASVYTTIAQLDNIDGPDAEVDISDVTALDSGVGREFKPSGHVNGGTVNLGGFFDPVGTTLQALTDIVTAPVVAAWKIIFSDAASTVWPFSGAMQKAPKPTAAVGEFLKFDASIKLDGMVAYPT